MCSLVTQEGGHVRHVAMHCFVFILQVKNILQVWNAGFSVIVCHFAGTCEEDMSSQASLTHSSIVQDI